MFDKKEYMKNYFRTHKEELRLKHKDWRKKNPDKLKGQNQRHQHTDTGLISQRKHYSKEHGLGYNPLNAFFKGSSQHHLDKTNVIHVPKELHIKTWHRQYNEKSMKKINLKAWDFMETNSY